MFADFFTLKLGDATVKGTVNTPPAGWEDRLLSDSFHVMIFLHYVFFTE